MNVHQQPWPGVSGLVKRYRLGHVEGMSDYLSGVRDAEQTMRSLFPATPLQRNDHLSRKFDAEIWLKREDLSPVRSYKLRGALNAIRKRPDQDLFVAASAGNHAQGVAYICRHLGKRGVIFMPVTTPQQKIQKTRTFGAEAVEIRLVGDYFDDCLAAAQAYCREVGAHFLSPFDDDDVIEGQATMTLEVLDQLTPDAMVLPVGGGGLSSGARQVLNASKASTELLLVEPDGGASLTAALQAGEPVTLNKVDSFVDGAAVARLGVRNFQALKQTPIDNVLTAPEDRICGTILEMLNVEGIVLEPAGALSLDVLDSLRTRIAGKTVVCVTSGGNFDFERLPEVKERAARFQGLKKYLVLRMPQRPGALKDFLNMLGPDDDISRFEYLKKSARNFGTVLIGIETSRAENFERLFELMADDGFTYNDITDDETLVSFIV